MFTSLLLLSLTLKVAAGGPELADPEARAWDQVSAARVALNRTPPLYDTDPPSEAEIGEVLVRLARVSGKLLVQMTWPDRTQDTATLAKIPDTAYEARNMKEHSAESSRFFDAAAVMLPSGGSGTPSLQMGDAQHPVKIYYWNAARGAMEMAAEGRSTTRRLSFSLPARSVWRAGSWRVVLELPEPPPGTPLSFAVWNGSQLDRDGRKYFSVWHWLEIAR
jgi:hypothetical protein